MEMMAGGHGMGPPVGLGGGAPKSSGGSGGAEGPTWERGGIEYLFTLEAMQGNSEPAECPVKEAMMPMTKACHCPREAQGPIWALPVATWDCMGVGAP